MTARGGFPPSPGIYPDWGRALPKFIRTTGAISSPQVSPLSFDLYSVLGLLDDLSIQSLLREPCIIIATNGMMVENTPSARIARWMIQEERHGIFFCGYIDPDTLGYRVFHARPGDRLAFSPGGGAGGGEEFEYQAVLPLLPRRPFPVAGSRPGPLSPRIIVLVHGEKEGMDSLQEELGKEFVVVQGEKGKTIELD